MSSWDYHKECTCWGPVHSDLLKDVGPPCHLGLQLEHGSYLRPGQNLGGGGALAPAASSGLVVLVGMVGGMGWTRGKMGRNSERWWDV